MRRTSAARKRILIPPNLPETVEVRDRPRLGHDSFVSYVPERAPRGPVIGRARPTSSRRGLARRVLVRLRGMMRTRARFAPMTAMSAQSASAIDAANPFPNPPDFRVMDTDSPSAPPRDPTSRWRPRPRVGDYSRTRFESRFAFGGPDEDAEEIATPTRQFSLLEITSGMPDDSRGEDDRLAKRKLRELRSRVKAARTAISATSGANDLLQQDRIKAGCFYARFGITQQWFRCELPDMKSRSEDD